MADLKLTDEPVRAGMVHYFFNNLAKYLLEIPFKVFLYLVREAYTLVKWLFVQLCPKWLQPILGVVFLWFLVHWIMDLYAYLSRYSFIDELTKSIVELVTK